MNNLFSIFDPCLPGVSICVNWGIFFLLGVFLPGSYWLSCSYSSMLVMQASNAIKFEFSSVFGGLAYPGTGHLFLSMAVSVMLMNLAGLLPYVFTLTSHLSVSLSLGLPLWIGYMLYSTFLYPDNFLSHLVPTGTPSALIFLMVIIEMISSFIRPFTLSIRLAANMVAGHLLISLLGNALDPFTVLSVSGVAILITFLLLILLESGVALIQSYVFSLLSSLYVSEVHLHMSN